jgi:hypothetical protein
LAQTIDHIRALRELEGNHSADQINLMWAEKKAGQAVRIAAEIESSWAEHRPAPSPGQEGDDRD